MKKTDTLVCITLFSLSLFTPSLIGVTNQPPSMEGLVQVQLDPIYLPSKNLQVLEFEQVDDTKDGLVSKELILKGKDITLVSIPLKNWTYNLSTPSDCSLQFKYRYNPSLAIEVSVFSKIRIGGTLDLNTAHQILTGIEGRFTHGLKLITTHSDIQPTGYLGNLLGSPSFCFDYEYSKNDDSVVRVRTYLLQYDQTILTVSLSGPTEAVETQIQTLEMLVHNLSVSRNTN